MPNSGLTQAAIADPAPAGPLELVAHANDLIDRGRWNEADAVLDEAYRLAEIARDSRSRASVTWSRAHVAAGRSDAVGAERLFREVERDAGDWWDEDGAVFLAGAARTLDTLGLTQAARGYLRRAEALAPSAATRAGANGGVGAGGGVGVSANAGASASAGAGAGFEPLALARALILARSGDPALALEALRDLVGRSGLEPRLRWRVTLMSAWARLRAGDRDGAGTEAAAGFAQATALGGLGVALAVEPDITAALAPLAADAGGAPAIGLLTPDASLVVWLFGAPKLARVDGSLIELPAGRPTELMRMLALAPHGLPVEAVLEAFFPDAAPQTARHRLRQVLTRLRAVAGEIVVRDEDMLKLLPAWVDVREFIVLTRRVRASRGTRQLILSGAASALADRGPLLAGYPEADWTRETRQTVFTSLATLEAITGAGADGASVT